MRHRILLVPALVAFAAARRPRTGAPITVRRSTPRPRRRSRPASSPNARRTAGTSPPPLSIPKAPWSMSCAWTTRRSSMDIAIGKAKAAATSRRPPRAFMEVFNKGGPATATLPGVFALPGGVPSMVVARPPARRRQRLTATRMVPPGRPRPTYPHSSRSPAPGDRTICGTVVVRLGRVHQAAMPASTASWRSHIFIRLPKPEVSSRISYHAPERCNSELATICLPSTWRRVYHPQACTAHDSVFEIAPRPRCGVLRRSDAISRIPRRCVRAADVGHTDVASLSSLDLHSNAPHSITSSARASSIGGTVRPSILAV